MTLEQLKNIAEKEREYPRVRIKPLLPTIEVLIGKGFSYTEIYRWLKSHSIPLPAKVATFRCAISKYKAEIKTAKTRKAKK